jgi:rare lipoprotein A
MNLAGKMLLATGALCSLAGGAWARSGRASYHAHTGALVTAARHEPRGSVLKVTNPENGKSVTVLVNDAGPFAPAGRVLDLSTGAFRELYGSLKRGHGPVQYEVVSRGPLASRGGKNKRSKKRSKNRSYRSRRSR